MTSSRRTDRHERLLARSSSSRARIAVVLCALTIIAMSCTSGKSSDTDGLIITPLSTRADMVTGDDLLIGIPGNGSDAKVTIDGHATSATFRGSSTVPMKAALIGGLHPGKHTIEVKADGGVGHLDVVAHPIDGPVFSGPHFPLTACTTTDFGLAASTVDKGCFAPTVVTWRYVGTDGKFHDLADPHTLPADVATTKSGGKDVPFVVRRERGVLNRAVYTIELLETAGFAADQPDAAAWNGRLVYEFGGGCGTTYTQGFDLLGATDPALIGKGYAVATSTFNTFQVMCNDVLSAETMMIVKEHFAEHYGVPVVTIGEGGSGGAIQQLMIAQNYPGLLDAIAPILPFPDAASIAGGVVDCALLNRYYRTSPAAAKWDATKRVAVNGHLTPATCDFWEQTFVPAIDPGVCGFGDKIQGATSAIPGLDKGFPQPPADQIYDAVKNPKGIRCTLQDANVNIYGRDPTTGFANRAWDNVGVQYGLAGLNSGALTPDEFVALNQSVGSFDIDGKWQAARAEADDHSLEVSYTSGRVNEGGGDLLKIPILTMNIYTDPKGDIHDRYRVFTIRERIVESDGSAAPNLVIWTRQLPPGKTLIDSLTGALGAGSDAIGLLDQWATDVKADSSSQLIATKLADHQPPKAINSCFDAAGKLVDAGKDIYYHPGACTDPYPIKGDPRTVAGSPIREDIIKCQLQSIDDAVATHVYTKPLTAAQRARLAATFPDGVCDWTQPGVDQAPLGPSWQKY